MADSATGLGLRQIFALLEKDFAPKIDLSDLKGRQPDEQRTVALSRSLAAFTALRVAEIPIEEAVRSVTDGFDDNGIDAICYNKIDKTLYCVQSKIRMDGTGSVDVGDMSKFVDGVRDLLNAKFDRFNSKLKTHIPLINNVLDDVNAKLGVVVAYTGSDVLSEPVKRRLTDFLAEQNKLYPEFATSLVLTLKEIHAHARDYGQPKPITLEVQLKNWGRISDPFEAYYGYIDTADVATWWQAHGARLLDQNIRYVLEGSSVNDEIIRTLESSPEKFWYFNNGITALCTSVRKKPAGGASTEAGAFTCTDVHIVNGAQTVGSIASFHLKPGQKAATGKVAIRFISLEKVPPEFANEVTRATNTQNNIDARDFVALDPQQERLKKELAGLEVQYSYKSGEPVPDVSKGFDIRDATIALACAHADIGLTVAVKRYIGGLWEDTSKPPYTELFNPKLTVLRCWRLVQISRAVDKALAERARRLEGRDRLIAVHGNRFVLHMAFKLLDLRQLDRDGIDLAPLIAAAITTAETILGWLIPATEKRYPGSYAGNIFKNRDRYVELEAAFIAESKAANAQGNLKV